MTDDTTTGPHNDPTVVAFRGELATFMAALEDEPVDIVAAVVTHAAGRLVVHAEDGAPLEDMLASLIAWAFEAGRSRPFVFTGLASPFEADAHHYDVSTEASRASAFTRLAREIAQGAAVRGGVGHELRAVVDQAAFFGFNLGVISTKLGDEEVIALRPPATLN